MITLEVRVDDTTVLGALATVNSFLSKVSRHLWVDLYIHKRPLFEVKAEAIKKYGISSRHFNSIRFVLDGKASALAESRKNEIANKSGAIAATKKRIKHLEATIKRKGKCLAQLAGFMAKVAAWRAHPQGKKKPKLPAKLQGQDRHSLKRELSLDKHTLHQKKRRLAILEDRLGRLQSSEHLSLAFGGKKLLTRQHHLKANAYSDHDTWLKDWRFARSNQSFWLGSHEETAHNVNAQYDPEAGELVLRVPYALEGELGSHIRLQGLFFPNKADRRQGLQQSPELLAAFSHVERVVKGDKQ